MLDAQVLSHAPAVSAENAGGVGLVDHQQGGGLHFNWDCLGNVIQNNVFALNGGPKQGQWTRYGDAPRGEDTNSNILMRNIVYWNNSRLWNEERWPNWRMILDFNLYYDASGKPLSLLGLTWDQWRTKNPTIGSALDYHSLVADPRFVDAADRIVWVAGHAVGEEFRVTPATSDVVILKLKYWRNGT